MATRTVSTASPPASKVRSPKGWIHVDPAKLIYALIAAVAGGGVGWGGSALTPRELPAQDRETLQKIEVTLAKIEANDTNRGRDVARLEGDVVDLKARTLILERKVK